MRYFLLLLGLVAGTAQASLIVDKSGVDEQKYAADMFQCTEASNQVTKESTSGAIGGGLKGAAAGAATGAAAGAISGGSGSSAAKKGAGVGVAVGMLGGVRGRNQAGGKYAADKQAVLRNCMIGRGYTVLN